VSEEREVKDLEIEESGEQDDVEAHKKYHPHADPTANDDSDDVEAHAKLHKH